MKVVRTIEVFNDADKKLEVGDGVLIQTVDGKQYKGTVKAFNPMNLALSLEEGGSCSILYKSIQSIN